MAQSRTVNGKVTSLETGEALPGVNILVQGSTTGTVTDLDGNYRISVPSDDAILVFSFIGYQAEEAAVNGRSTVNVALSPSLEQLSEVVVTSFGIERDKKALGYSVQEVSGEEITRAKQPNVVNALQGRVAGVQIQSAGGQPGAGSNIIIRGITSLSPNADNQPLFVVDGIPISNQTQAGSTLPSAGSNSPGSSEQYSFSNRAVDLNPDDIESMSILKGPAATALYGLRAANGAVIITTKKGKAGATTVNVTSSVGFDYLNKAPEIQSQYREGRYGRLRFYANGDPLRFQSFGPPVVDGTPVINNFETFFQTGSRVDNSVSVSGGSETSTFFVSASRLDQKGIVPFSDWDRTTLKLSGTTKVGERLNVNGTVNYINSGGARASSGDKSIFSSLTYYSPTFDVNDYINPDGSQRDFSDGIIDNPVYIARFSSLNDDVNRIIGNVGFNYKFTDWLNLDYKIGSDVYSDSRDRVGPPNTDVGSQVKGFIVEEKINYREINSNLIVSAQKDFTERFRGQVLLGNNVTDISYSSLNTRGEGFALSNFNDLSNATNLFSTKDESLRRIVGVFANVELEYDGTYFLTITGRNDWSSTLPEGNNSFFYPSVNLGYVFTETLGLGDNPVFNYGKLRLSYAEVGKDASAYQVGSYYEVTPGFPFSGVNGFRLDDQVGSPNLRPERTKSFEVGADLRFFNNRLAIDAAYFDQTSIDQIIPVPVSNATGYSTFVTNAGELRNKGIELLITATPVRNSNITWESSLNFTSINNEVISMPDDVDEIIFTDAYYIQNKLVEGGSAGDLYGFDFERTDDGRLIIDESGFPTVNTTEYVKVGNALPDFTSGLTNTITYKGLSLSFLLEWRQGGDVFDVGLRNSIRNGVLEETSLRYEQVMFNGVRNEGTAENPQYVENDIPVEINGESLYRSFGRYNSAAEVVLQDASWFRLRNASLSYALPTALLENSPFNKVNFTLTGNNLLLSTPFRGYDPEGSQFGSGSNSYGFTGLGVPQTRSYTFTVNLNF